MKKTILITLLFFCFQIQAQIVNIPDVNFKNTLVNFNCVDLDGDGFGDDDVDTNNDGEIQVSEAESVLRLNVSSKSIDSLEGIQSFINLIQLNCLSNQLTSLNVTQNNNLEKLYCGDNLLAGLDVTQNLNLKSFIFYSNPISTIDLSNNLYLEIIAASYCNLITLDVSYNKNLIHAELHNNSLTSLDFSQNPNLTFLWCFENQLNGLSVKNGNNLSLVNFRHQYNPNLFCVEIDDEVYANSQFCEGINTWCKDDWTEYNEDCSLGSEYFAISYFNIYPNPVNNEFYIDSQLHIEKVQIYNMHGILVKESISESINVSDLPSGIYFTKVSSNGKIQAKKFIKN